MQGTSYTIHMDL